MNFSTIDSRSVYYFDRKDDPVVEMLQRNQLYGKIMYNLVDRYLKLPSTILDVGANFGTFSFVPVQKGHTVLAVESDIDILSCLQKTYSDCANITIIEDIPKTSYDIECIHFARKTSLAEDISICADILAKNKPILLVEINVLDLKQNNHTHSYILELLESLGFYSFLYNAPNFLLAVDKNSVFPFCEMVLISMHKDTIIDNIGRITYGEYLPKDMLDNLLNTNLATADGDCLIYLNTLVNNLS